ncbi:MAG: hypothetical protein OEN01_13465 [Candidatus Krumholzibacteria bacterium]|nr:hypothetical protein [Candidatus Krumholzibacteria bacterium]
MGFEFLGRVRKTSVITGLVIFLVAVTYWDLATGVGWMLGCIWSLVNIYFIGLLVRTVWSQRQKNRLRVALIFLVKVPVLYAIGFLLLSSHWLPTIALLAGFMWPLLVVTMKILGRAVLRLDRQRVIGSSAKPLQKGIRE